jgi:ATP-dependent Lon protease|tara:strand:- start:16207 stop:18546 length:2340 start_codon:yes stop_codon:yes gene_type:complete
MVIPLFVGRQKSIVALEKAVESGTQILLLAQRDAMKDDPEPDDIYKVGTLASILQLLKLPDGTVKVLVEGESRAKLVQFVETEECFIAETEEVTTTAPTELETEVLMRTVLAEFDRYVKLNNKIPPEILTSLSGIEDPGRLGDTVAAHLTLKIEDKQKILEMLDAKELLEYILGVMQSEIDLMQVEKRIRGRVKKQMEKSQREYYLNEQMKAIQKELGEMEDGTNELDELASKIAESGMSKEALEKAEGELKKLKMMSPMSAEATVVRNYIDWLLAVPWKKRSKVRKDLKRAEQVLEEDHYGLDKVKERILEYLAVQQRVRKLKGPILCLVGPPGVGKTSLGQSIARATNRKFLRMSLGGVRDEAEIRGHRRTYIGSLPGKIVQNLSKAKVRNPLFMLDEVDKMSMDFRGDPSSALLEVLDPEQNHTFGDHYLEVDYDLSEVMFVATANTLNIPGPLLDRMEVIRISGYTEDEKINIAIRYLVPKQRENNGLKENEIKIPKSVITDIVRYYSRESGVRGLEREIAKICRKVTKELLLSGQRKQAVITRKNLEKYLGVRQFRYGMAEEKNRVGLVTGLAWTEMGGELLTIESTVMQGKGKHIFTGKLGEVMQESIQAAVSVVRGRSEIYGIDPDFYQNRDIHVHVPEGATPKDGPSAGVGMCTAILSALTDIPVRADVAMTGEITLRGEVLPIGGLKEKLLAAHRGGINCVLIPAENEKDLVEIPRNVKEGLEIIPVRWIDEVLDRALVSVPKPITGKGSTNKKTKGRRNKISEDQVTAH